MVVKVGDIFGFLEIKELVNAHHFGNSWICKCVCGKELKILEGDLFRRKNRSPVKSCGCKRKLQHGYSITHKDLHMKWSDMKARCYKSGKDSSIYYKEKGIAVCEEWREDLGTFIKWSMENGYEKGLSLDRLDNEKDYSPSNCRWTTSLVQAQNRGMHRNNTSGAKGVRKTSYGRYQVYITREFQRYNLGMYDTFEDAVKTREDAERHYEAHKTLRTFKPEWERLRKIAR